MPDIMNWGNCTAPHRGSKPPTYVVNPSAGIKPVARQNMVLIARAIQSSCNFLILDEPTAPLSENETKELLTLWSVSEVLKT